MAETRQFTVRIPDEARDVLTRIATRLREDGQFAARLEAWMDTLDDPTDTPQRDAPGAVRQFLPGGESPVSTPTRVADTLDTPPLTTGEGGERRLTTAGELEVERRIQSGEDNATIARALDVSTNAVQARRKEIDDRLL